MSGTGERHSFGERAGRAVGAMVIAVGLMSSAPAFAQSSDLRPLLDRIQRIERDIRTLNTQISRGGSPAQGQALTVGAPSEAVSDNVRPTIERMELRLTALETELRDATGRAEDVSYQLNQMNQRLEKLIGDVDFRLSQLERGQAELRAQVLGEAAPPVSRPRASGAIATPPEDAVQQGDQGVPTSGSRPGVLGTMSRDDMERLQRQQPAAGTGGTPPAPAPQTAAVDASAGAGTPEEQYNRAFGLLRQARYDDAEVALRAFLEAHGDNKLADNARYWLGETYYVRGDYVRAAEAFLDAYQKDQSGPKAPDTLLKLGMSLANLDKKREACAAFGKLSNEYPDAASNIKRLVEREQSKYGCQ